MNVSVCLTQGAQREGQSLGTTKEPAQDRAPVPACRVPQLAEERGTKSSSYWVPGPGEHRVGASGRLSRSYEVEPDALSRALACSPTYFQVSVKLRPSHQGVDFRTVPEQAVGCPCYRYQKHSALSFLRRLRHTQPPSEHHTT